VAPEIECVLWRVADFGRVSTRPDPRGTAAARRRNEGTRVHAGVAQDRRQSCSSGALDGVRATSLDREAPCPIGSSRDPTVIARAGARHVRARAGANTHVGIGDHRAPRNRVAFRRRTSGLFHFGPPRSSRKRGIPRWPFGAEVTCLPGHSYTVGRRRASDAISGAQTR
jgi:hypothetical protein